MKVIKDSYNGFDKEKRQKKRKYMLVETAFIAFIILMVVLFFVMVYLKKKEFQNDLKLNEEEAPIGTYRGEYDKGDPWNFIK